MHTVVSYFAFAWMTVLVAVSVAAVIRLPTTAGRILALDTLTLILVALLVLYADTINPTSRAITLPRSRKLLPGAPRVS